MKQKIGRIIFYILIIALSFYGAVSAEVLDRIVAIVDTDIITQVQLSKGTAPYIKQIETYGYAQEKQKEMKAEVTKKILDQLIEMSLTQQEARKYKIRVSEAEINNAIENVKENKGLSDQAFETALAGEGLTLKEYRKNVENQILRAMLINHAVKSKVIISKSQIEKYFEENKDKYTGTQKHHIRNILMNNVDQIDKIKTRLDAKDDFIQLAKDYSMAPNALDGGYIGAFDVSKLPQSIKDGLSGLEKGEHTDVISTAQGYQIFYVEDIVMEGGKSLEKVHDEIHGILYREEVERKFKAWIESLKKKAHIKIML